MPESSSTMLRNSNMNFREGLKNLAPFVELVSAWVEERNSPVIIELINYSTKAAELLPDPMQFLREWRIGFQLAVLISKCPFLCKAKTSCCAGETMALPCLPEPRWLL